MARALDAVKPALTACGEPVDLTVTFTRTGHVTSVSGTAATTPAYRQCLQRATEKVTVRPFARESVWTRYVW
jgi:hypothetical protein